MCKQCDNCKYAEETLLDSVCINEISAYFFEIIRKDNLCKCWEGKNADSRT